MGAFHIVALSVELAVCGWYIAVPLQHQQSALIAQDLAYFWNFVQSLAASAILSPVRMAFFLYIRASSKRAPATRCFVFFIFITEGAICAFSSLQPLVFWRNPDSFRQYRAMSWGESFIYTFWVLTLCSTLLQLVYILRLNKSRGRLSDDRLIDAVLNERSERAQTNANVVVWRSKWSQLVNNMRRRHTTGRAFEAIVRLYAQRDKAVERLAVVYDRNPAEIEFYLPQLCSFLLLGRSLQSPQLLGFLLDKCSGSHVFAHRLLWYFQSYCLHNPEFSGAEDNDRIRVVIDEVRVRGIEPIRAVECPSFDADDTKERRADSMCAHEIDGLLSGKEEQYQTFDIPIDLERGLVSPDPFQLETTFLNALASISSALRSESVGTRNDRLRQWLFDLQNQYLPSNSLYLPVGNPYHRLKRIHVGESFTFSTRERVPYLLCAEVIDYTPPQARRLHKRGSMFQGRFKLQLWEKGRSSSTIANSSALSTPDKPLLSPDAAALGFWSESKPPPSPTRLRSFSQQLTSSISQPGELFSGLIDTLVRKTPLARHASVSSALKHKADDDAHHDHDEFIMTEGEATDSPTPLSAVRRALSERSSLTPGTKANLHIDVERTRSLNRRDDLLSPRSEDTPISPHSPSSAYFSPSGTLNRRDSTDAFLEKYSDRESMAADEEGSEVSLTSGSRSDVPTVIFKERWAQKEARIRVSSPWGNHPHWRLLPVIIKSNDDLRQEQLASQLIRQFDKIFVEAKLSVFVRPYDVIAITQDSGMVEAIADTISLDSLKRNDREYTTLLDFFRRHFGVEGTSEFRTARNNFVSSMAAYSIICYLMQIKDRHNGNILLDGEGHIIHVDFGFMLSNNPGNMAFERAPFKLTSEFVQLMGGPRSAAFRRFRSLCVRAFLVARKYRHRFVMLVEMMVNGNEHLPCFAGDPRGTVDRFAARFQPGLDINACEDFVHELIDASLDNWRTNWYDKYQRWCVGVF